MTKTALTYMEQLVAENVEGKQLATELLQTKESIQEYMDEMEEATKDVLAADIQAREGS